nr:mucin-2-like [Penaeus vannamei]
MLGFLEVVTVSKFPKVSKLPTLMPVRLGVTRRFVTTTTFTSGVQYHTNTMGYLNAPEAQTLVNTSPPPTINTTISPLTFYYHHLSPPSSTTPNTINTTNTKLSKAAPPPYPLKPLSKPPPNHQHHNLNRFTYQNPTTNKTHSLSNTTDLKPFQPPTISTSTRTNHLNTTRPKEPTTINHRNNSTRPLHTTTNHHTPSPTKYPPPYSHHPTQINSHPISPSTTNLNIPNKSSTSTTKYLTNTTTNLNTTISPSTIHHQLHSPNRSARTLTTITKTEAT